MNEKINSNKNFEYIEFGKVYSEYDSSDFQILDRSSDDILDIAGRTRCERFMDRGLRFPSPASRTPFSNKIPNISVCFIKPSEHYYLFVQIQRRQEGDWALKNGLKPRLNRPFNHIRFTYIDKESLKFFQDCFSREVNGYSSLLYVNHQKDNFGKDEYALKDYFQIGGKKEVFSYAESSSKKHIIINSEYVKILVNSVINKFIKNKSFSIQILNFPLIDWKQKLLLIDELQKTVFPFIGLFTFALDYITDRGDINLHFYSDPKISEAEPVEWGEVPEIDYYSQIVDTASKTYYIENIKDSSFVQEIMDLFFDGVSIPDAVGIACILQSKSHMKDVNAWQIINKSQNFLTLDSKGQIVRYIDNASFTIAQLELLLLTDWVILYSASLKYLLIKFGEKYTTSDYQLLVSVLSKHTKIVLETPEIISFFSQKVDFEQIINLYEVIDESLRYEIFCLKSSESKDWINAYLSFSFEYRKLLSDQLMEWYKLVDVSIHVYFKDDQDSLLVVYNNLIDFLLDKGIFFSSKLFIEWKPKKNLILDKAVYHKLSSISIFLFDFMQYVIKTDDIQKFKWLLTEYPLDSEEIINLLALILDEIIISTSDNTDKKAEMFQLCKKILVEKKVDYDTYYDLDYKFFVYRFPFSSTVQNWFFKSLVGGKSSKTEQFINALLQSPNLEKGILYNPELGVLLSGTIEQIIQLSNKKRLGDSIIESVLSARKHDKFFMSNSLEFLINLLPDKQINLLLSKIVKKNLCKEISQDIGIKWLEKTRDSELRKEYFINKRDGLRFFLANLINNDRFLWESFVVDTIFTFSDDFSWEIFVRELPYYHSDNSDYKNFKELVNSIGEPKFHDKKLYLTRLKICIQLTQWVIGKEEVGYNEIYNYYHDNNIDDVELKRIIKKKLHFGYEFFETTNPKDYQNKEVHHTKPLAGNSIRKYTVAYGTQFQHSEDKSSKEKKTIIVFLILTFIMCLGVMVIAIIRLFRNFTDIFAFFILIITTLALFIILFFLFTIFWRR